MNSNEIVPETRVVDEIPDSMKRLASMVARAFYGPEHGIVVDYIKRNVCIKEEVLRDLIKFEQRHLRTLLITLRMDKIVKERVNAEDVDGKSRKFNYYFINYRALLNVTKYKLDHMRQKLESREKDDTHKASYKCTGCKQHYDVMEVDTIFDPMTQELRCWRCHQLVEEDESAGPSTTTRSMLAKFNEELAPLFGILQQLDGTQLAPHLLEPPLPLPKAPDEGANAGGGNRRAVPLGGISHGGNFPTFDMYTQQGFTVNIEGDASSSNAETAVKEVPTWLQDTAHADSVPTVAETEQASLVVAAHLGGLSSPTASRAIAESPRAAERDVVASLLQHEVDSHKSPIATRPPEPTRTDADDHDAESSDDGSFEDVEDEVTVQGRKYLLAQVNNDPQLVSQMTEAERAHYIKIVQAHVMDHDFD
uniref:HTH TFE/IIEalpha-type domain-containing protein n=1 Tax=Plectus sambesii TaxID=2011161 RepID=A0A914X0T9_9BILA